MGLIPRGALLGLLLLGLTACASASPTPPSADPSAPARLKMVQDQIRVRGVADPAVLSAMETVPRHEFVPPDLTSLAYEDHPLAIGYGQTISQPYVVAWMTELLDLSPGEVAVS